MSQNNTIKRRIDVDEIASKNPAINADKFKEWRRKMERIERLNLDSGEEPKQRPQDSKPSVPNGLGLFRVGNLSGQ
ncbi:MAG: hypothetical protein OXF52_02730 [Candidatus Dadabacteria bacterium]|nr:hypothetical protein [Candidatus Dadabacteria bacterium]